MSEEKEPIEEKCERMFTEEEQQEILKNFLSKLLEKPVVEDYSDCLEVLNKHIDDILL